MPIDTPAALAHGTGSALGERIAAVRTPPTESPRPAAQGIGLGCTSISNSLGQRLPVTNSLFASAS